MPKQSPASLTTNSLEELLDSILSTGRDLKEQVESGELQTKAKAFVSGGEDKLADAFNIAKDEDARAKFRKNSRMAAGASALAILLTSRSGRNKAKLAGLAGIGALAFAAYKKNGNRMPTSKDEVIGLIRGESADKRSRALLTAMVAAAQIDGKMSPEETKMIFDQAGDGQDMLGEVLASNPNVASVVALADSPQAAREIYAVSARVANGLNAAERDYLDNLAMALDLDPDTAAHIETDVRV